MSLSLSTAVDESLWAQAKACQLCSTAFGLFGRLGKTKRHHCRTCAKSVCGLCAPFHSAIVVDGRSSIVSLVCKECTSVREWEPKIVGAEVAIAAAAEASDVAGLEAALAVVQEAYGQKAFTKLSIALKQRAKRAVDSARLAKLSCIAADIDAMSKAALASRDTSLLVEISAAAVRAGKMQNFGFAQGKATAIQRTCAGLDKQAIAARKVFELATTVDGTTRDLAAAAALIAVDDAVLLAGAAAALVLSASASALAAEALELRETHQFGALAAEALELRARADVAAAGARRTVGAARERRADLAPWLRFVEFDDAFLERSGEGGLVVSDDGLSLIKSSCTGAWRSAAALHGGAPLRGVAPALNCAHNPNHPPVA